MNRILLLLLLTVMGIGSSATQAQEGSLRISRDTLHSKNGRVIPALHLTSKHGFHTYKASADGHISYLMMKKYSRSANTWGAKGRILCFDHQKDSVIWMKKTKAIGLAVCNDHLLENNSGSTNWYSEDNGRLVWQNKEGPLVYKDCKRGFGITFLGTIINLENGKANKPGQQLAMQNGIDEVIALPDGRTLISASGLTLLDTSHSIEAHVPENTGFRPTGRVVANAAGMLILAGALGYAAYDGVPATLDVPSNVPVIETRVSGLCSNVLMKGNRIFQAYGGKLVCYDNKLNKIWTTTFEKEKTGASRISIQGDTLVLISQGIGYLGKSPYKVGEPGLFFFEPEQGRVLDSIRINTKGKGILDVTFINNYAFVLTSTEELTISFEVGNLLHRVQIAQEGNGPEARYVKPDGMRTCPETKDSCISHSEKPAESRYISLPGGILEMDGTYGRIRNELRGSELCICCTETSTEVLLNCANNMTLTDADGKITDHIPLKGDAVRVGDRLYFRESGKNSLYIMDMRSLIDGY